MIEFVSLTGEIEKGLVGCESYGRHFFARPVFGTVFQSIPSQAWLDKYKKHFFGVVGYENQKNNCQYDRPLFFGVTPINNDQYQGDNIEDRHKIRTAKFEIVINDTEETLQINSDNVNVLLDNKSGLVTIKNGKTSLKQILYNIMKTYLKTTTIDKKPLSPDSMNDAMDNIQEINKLLQ